MTRETGKRNRIDFLFPLILFFIFSILAVMVLLFSARVYKKVVEEGSSNNSASTAAAYITEKVHQNDVKERIHVRSSLPGEITFSGNNSPMSATPCLALQSEHGGDLYETDIYYYDGTLRELFAKEGAVTGPESGTVLFELSEADFSLEEDLLHISLTDKNGNTADCSVLIHSN